MRKRLLFFAIAVVSLSAFGAGAAEITAARSSTPRIVAADDVRWVGVAASPRTGRVFQSEPKGYENDGRAAAIAECERATGSSCARAIAVPREWDVTVLRCGGDMFLGGSGQSYADEIAYGKAAAAGYSSVNCNKVGSY